MHLCNRWGTGELKIFRGSDYAHIGNVKFLEDVDSIGYDPTPVTGRASSTPPRWFERLLAELGFEVWMGDPAEIKAKRVKKQWHPCRPRLSA